MSIIKEDLNCPNCQKKNRIKIHNEVTSEEIINIIDRSLFKITCSSCKQEMIVEYPLKVVAPDYIVYFKPEESFNIGEEKEYMRICLNFADFKEKLLILNDSLNDIAIEFIKQFLLTQLDENIKKEVTDIRYDGQNEENLIFYLLGVKKSIGCRKEFYDEILKKSKIKKSDKAIIVDSHTYKNYFKLR